MEAVEGNEKMSSCAQMVDLLSQREARIDERLEKIVKYCTKS